MAEAIGAVAGIVALAQSAFESSVALHQLVKSFRSHNSRVRELGLELGALCEVLGALSKHTQETKTDVSSLKIPLQQCTNVCTDFGRQLTKCAAHSKASGTSFRDWTKLRFMGDDIDGFRRLIASYKLTMTIALNDANLQASAATAESVETYHDLIQTTQEDLRDRVQSMDEKLDHLLRDKATPSNEDLQAARLIQEERLSAEKCLEICADLSSRVAELQRTARDSMSAEEASTSPTPGKIYSDGLQECADSLARTAEKLAGCESQLFDRLMEKTNDIGVSEDLSRLRNELVAMRQSMAICDKAREHLREEVATIDNYATGDAVQLMVSINDKPIHGKNRGTGWRTRQLGGYVDKDALRDAIRFFSNPGTLEPGSLYEPPAEDGPVIVNDDAAGRPMSAFSGKGQRLVPTSVSSDQSSKRGR